MPITTKNLLLKKTKFHSLTGNTQKTTPGNRLSSPINLLRMRGLQRRPATPPTLLCGRLIIKKLEMSEPFRLSMLLYFSI